MEPDANTYYLNKWMEEQEENSRQYEAMLEELRDAGLKEDLEKMREPEEIDLIMPEYYQIIKDYGFETIDYDTIIKDL